MDKLNEFEEELEPKKWWDRKLFFGIVVFSLWYVACQTVGYVIFYIIKHW